MCCDSSVNMVMIMIIGGRLVVFCGRLIRVPMIATPHYEHHGHWTCKEKQDDHREFEDCHGKNADNDYYGGSDP